MTKKIIYLCALEYNYIRLWCTSYTSNDESIWNQVGAKENIKEKKIIQDEYSNRHAPMYLPEEPPYNEDDIIIPLKTTKVLPITIRVTSPTKYKVKNGRLLVAILRALQKVEPTTYISPISEAFKMEKILHPRDIPCDEDTLRYYMEEPTFNRYKNYSTRIYVCSNLTLEEYKHYKSEGIFKNL